MKYYNQLPLKYLQLMIEREIIAIEETHDVTLVSIEFHDDELYQQGDGHTCQTIYAQVAVEGATICYELEWDTEDEEITTVMRAGDPS